jgi:hypothetical protein
MAVGMIDGTSALGNDGAESKTRMELPKARGLRGAGEAPPPGSALACADRCNDQPGHLAALVPAILPNTAPFVRPVPPG